VLGAGVAGAYAFPAAGIWPLAFVSVAGLSVAVHGRRARRGGWLGLLYGLAFFVPLLHWTGVYVGPVPWLLLAAGEAGFCAGLGAVLTLVQRLPGWPVWAAGAWVLEEFARDRIPFGGFPWGRLAFSQAASPVRWFAPLGGAPLVSFAVGFGGACLAAVVLHLSRGLPSGWPAARLLAAGLVGVLAAPALGALLALGLAPGPDRAGRTAVVALVQGSVPDVGLAFEQRARQVLDNHLAETEKLVAQIRAGTVPQPQLVVWPENASDVDPLTDPAAHAAIDRVVAQLGVPLLVGAILPGPGPDHRRNAGILWSPQTGPGAEYIKRHPVPFGEYIPLRSISDWVSSDAKLVTRDMVAGHGNGLITGGPFPFGDVICFEVAYDSLVRSSVAAGARLLVVQTNNATFGHTAETYQQLAMSRLRAVETGRTVLQVATTGKSAVIGPDGTVRQESGALFTPDLLVARVPLRTAQTPAVRLGPVPEYVLAALAVGAALWSLLPNLRSRSARRGAGRAAHEPAPPAGEKVTT
jgi:apolipoprotein N-acyltransferase